MKLTEMFSPMEQRRITQTILNSNITAEQVIVVIEAAAEMTKQGIKPELFFKAFEKVYDEMMKK